MIERNPDIEAEFLDTLSFEPIGIKTTPSYDEQWVVSTEGQKDQPPWAAWLACANQSTHHCVVVGTHPRQEFEQAFDCTGVEADTQACANGLLKLMNFSLPHSIDPEIAAELRSKITQHAESLAEGFRDWETSTVTLDSTETVAAKIPFSTGVLFFIDADPKSRIIAITQRSSGAQAALEHLSPKTPLIIPGQAGASLTGVPTRSVAEYFSATSIDDDWRRLLD